MPGPFAAGTLGLSAPSAAHEADPFCEPIEYQQLKWRDGLRIV
ncbi:hypothetical protein [Nitrobacter sp.]|nr:hypothetical protein [Nitrobacter sp.]